MAKAKRQPTEEEQQNLDEVLEDSVSEVELRGRKMKIGWMRKGTLRKISHIMLSDDDEMRVTTKCAAAMVLNGYWRIKLLWWLLWRKWYYLNQYSDKELSKIIDEGKKKVQVLSYYVNIISLTEMKDTILAMTREEVERYRQGQATAQPTASGKSAPG